MSDIKGIVTTNKLNVRSGPGMDFPVVCQLVQGTLVQIQRHVGDWKELNLTDLEGYANRAYLVITSPEREDKYGIIEADALNVRSGPGYEFETITIIRKGASVEIVAERNDWLRIKTRYLNGYILDHLVAEIIGGKPIAGSSYLAAVNEDLVNLRSGPGLEYAVVAVLAKDTEVQVQRRINGWVQVETIQYEGFIRTDFVKRAIAEHIISIDPNTITFASSTVDLLSLRTGPDEKYLPIAYLMAGTQLKVKDIATNWVRVQPLFSSAYVSGNYIREIRPEAPIPIPGPQDPLKPPAYQTVLIQDHFSAEQKIMANTWNEYGGLVQQISSQFSLDPIVALAVLGVESGGKGFGPDGRMMIRFENHYFYHYWGASHEDRYRLHFKFDAGTTWKGHQYRLATSSPWRDVHTGDQRDEWQVFEFAVQFDRTAALKSISMGSPQIMGANYHLVNYASVEQMFYAFQSSIVEQIWGLFRYIKSKNLIPDLIAQDFIAFARVYNGPAQASSYGNKIKRYVEEFRKISPLI